MTTFVLATANPHKAVEMTAVLAELGIAVRERPAHAPDVEETADSLEGNALLKARALCELTGEPAVADDTGLFVDALEGRPGVFSARYAGENASYEDNVALLLSELAEVAPPRGARFVTVIAVVYPDGREVTVEGILEGEIALAPRGSNGFGYDPVFEIGGEPRRTLAEVSDEEKNALSHRSRALRALAVALSK